MWGKGDLCDLSVSPHHTSIVPFPTQTLLQCNHPNNIKILFAIRWELYCVYRLFLHISEPYDSDGLSIESPKGEKKARLIPLALLVPFPNLFENLVLLLGG